VFANVDTVARVVVAIVAVLALVHFW